ncbi:NRDE family protein [soil metagenome]
MCTVTVLPFGDRLFITSNRDEHIQRTPAELPEPVSFSSGRILFPRDGQAGGTWVASHENGNVMVLMNGGIKKHKHLPPYRRSRGLIFLDIFNSLLPVNEFEKISLDGIEPFTLVIYQQGSLWKAIWDGSKKYLEPVDKTKPQIWSSVTLYDKEVRLKREQWFHKWLEKTMFINAEAIREFHEFAGEGDAKTSLRMNRDGVLMTVSITGMELSSGNLKMFYKDLQAGLISINEWMLPAGERIVL